MASQLAEGSPYWARPYRSARPRALVATVLLSLTIVTSLAIVLGAIGLFGSWDDPNFNYILLVVLVVLEAVLYVADWIAFLFWFRLVYRNLPALGAQELGWSPRSAVLWWFVPFAAWVVPFRVTVEVFKASDPGIVDNTRNGRAAAAYPPVLLAWWLAWVATSLTAGLRRTVSNPGVFTVVMALEISAAVLAICVIWTIQWSQDRRVQA